MDIQGIENLSNLSKTPMKVEFGVEGESGFD